MSIYSGALPRPGPKPKRRSGNPWIGVKHRLSVEGDNPRGQVALTNLDNEEYERLWYSLYETPGLLRDIRGGQNLFVDRLPRAATDEDVSAWAERRAHAVAKVVARNPDTWAAYAEARTYATSFGINVPDPKKTDVRGPHMASIVRRMQTARWWRKTGRVAHARKWEGDAHKAGLVNIAKTPCASDWGVNFVRERAEGNHQLLLQLIAVNEDGETVCLADAAAASVANPKLRRMELMARMNGAENVAKDRGDVPLFVTLTAPSRFHRWCAKPCIPNPRYDGKSTPRDGQAHLNTVWARCRAKFTKAGVGFYGFRSVEPHHDGTPHWHMMLFVQPEHVKPAIKIMHAEALKEDADEPGARKRRIRFKRINPSRGTATGYMAKYIAKGVDGFGLTHAQLTLEDGKQTSAPLADPVTHAARIVAWSRIWGIRQFQFFGLPSQTVYRELRRVRDVRAELPLIEPVRAAADAGDVAAFIGAMGGPCLPRDERPLAIWRDDPQPVRSLLSGYGDYAPHPIRGVLVQFMDAVADKLLTRPHTWRVERLSGKSSKGAAESPLGLVSITVTAADAAAASSPELHPAFLSDQGQNNLSESDP